MLGAIMKKRKADSIVPEDTASYGSFCRAANAIARLSRTCPSNHGAQGQTRGQASVDSQGGVGLAKQVEYLKQFHRGAAIPASNVQRPINGCKALARRGGRPHGS